MSLSKAGKGESRAAGQLSLLADWRTVVQTLSILFKWRIVALLLLAAVGGAFLGARSWPGLGPLLVLFLSGGLAASGAAGLNEFLERSSDGVMRRTQRRPLVIGSVRPQWVLGLSIAMILLPSLAVLPFNPALAFFLLLGAIIYVGIYTIWLKPRTLLNIVIGGAAGSAAVMSGGAAAGAWQDPAVIVLALLVFLWTPSHFWSLAILYREDYARAGVPMLPVQTTVRQSAWWVLLHTGAAGLAALALTLAPALGWAYLLPVAVATADLFRRNGRLIAQPTPQHARSLFISSNLYLMVVLLAIMTGTLLHAWWSAF
ncbi:MAG: heme o synthase [Chloroflexi bacterium]|nr:heme o synthase [Chloroflexota bacterium]MCI0647017.1 heme o synthase [Chloroflexota bacterium]MCI0730717.1 heme o synthase [Chloroflexota bacterium]